MTSKSFAQWVKEKRTKKKLSVKDFEKKFNQFRKNKGVKSYQWFTSFERYGEFAKKEFEILKAMAQFFGYRFTLVPDKDVSLLSADDLKELQTLLDSERTQEAETTEQDTQQNITNKTW